MTHHLSTFLTAMALLALPGCGGKVLVDEPDGPTTGVFNVYQSPPNRVSALAGFYQGLVSTPTEVARDGACWLDHYELPEMSPGKAVAVDAGELRVTGGLTDLVANFDGKYAFPELSAMFQAGDMLTLDVEGSDDVAPMSVTLPAPPLPVIALPPATIDTGEDLGFTWTSPPGTGTLTIQVQGYWPGQSDPPGLAYYPRDIARCQADVSQGTLTMPASLLSQVSNDRPEGATVYAYAQNWQKHHTGDFAVGFGVSTNAATPSGQSYSLDADLKK